MNSLEQSDADILYSFQNNLVANFISIPKHYFDRLRKIVELEVFDNEDIDECALNEIIKYANNKTTALGLAIKPLVSKSVLTPTQSSRYDRLYSQIEQWAELRNGFSVFKHTGRLDSTLKRFFDDIRGRLIVYLSKPMHTTLMRV